MSQYFWAIFLDRSAAKISECSQRSSPHSCTLQSRSMKYRRCFSIVYCMIVMLLGNRDPLQVCGDMLVVRSRRSRKYSPCYSILYVVLQFCTLHK